MFFVWSNIFISLNFLPSLIFLASVASPPPASPFFYSSYWPATHIFPHITSHISSRISFHISFCILLVFPLMMKMGNDKEQDSCRFWKRKSLRCPWRSFSCFSYQSPLFSPANIAPRFSPRISGDVAFKYLSYIQSQSRLLCCWVKHFIGALYPSKICAK